MLNFDITQTMVGKQLKQKYLEQGVKKGIKDGQILVAMNLLNKGFDIRIVQEMTELSEKDLKKLVLFLNK